MAGGQERILRGRIRSIQATKKITRAMELIAASRIVKAQQRVHAAVPYSDLITDVVKRREKGLAGMDAYVCGPPPMVDAAIATLTALGVKENNIHYDKFTTTGEPEA